MIPAFFFKEKKKGRINSKISSSTQSNSRPIMCPRGGLIEFEFFSKPQSGEPTLETLPTPKSTENIYVCGHELSWSKNVLRWRGGREKNGRRAGIGLHAVTVPSGRQKGSNPRFYVPALHQPVTLWLEKGDPLILEFLGFWWRHLEFNCQENGAGTRDYFNVDVQCSLFDLFNIYLWIF